MEENQVLLECRGIYKSFGKNKVLQDINLRVRKGEVHALLGQNGAGKSTLVKIITGVYSMNAGEIFMDGEPVRIKFSQGFGKCGNINHSSGSATGSIFRCYQECVPGLGDQRKRREAEL